MRPIEHLILAAWRDRFHLPKTTASQMSDFTLCALSAAKSDEARRLMLGIGEKGMTGYMPDIRLTMDVSARIKYRGMSAEAINVLVNQQRKHRAE